MTSGSFQKTFRAITSGSPDPLLSAPVQTQLAATRTEEKTPTPNIKQEQFGGNVAIHEEGIGSSGFKDLKDL